jgi:hypothetical protein
MTEHLSTLLHDQAAGLHVPVAPVDEVLAGGRAIRRRRRIRIAVASAAAVAVVAAGAAVLGQDRSDTTPEPARLPDRAAYEQLGAWAVGDEVHIGNHTANVEGVQELQYTSVGVVVTVVVAGRNHYTLVTQAGEVEPLDLDLPEPLFAPDPVATDPTSANVAYVRALDSHRAQAVVRDLATGDETTVGKPVRTQRADDVDWISGDLIRVSNHVVDWRTGSPVRITQRGWWHGSGVSVDYDLDGTWTLTSFDGDTLLTVPGDPVSTYGTLSPDGRYFAVSDTEPTITVYELASGEATLIEGRAASNYGWSPDGHLVGRPTLSSSELEVCDPATGECKDTGANVTGEVTLVAGIPGVSL